MVDQSIEGLDYEVRDRVAYLTINRPEKLNALDPAMYAGLRTYVIQADLDDDVQLIVLRAVGDRAFCTGGDLVQGTTDWSDPAGLPARLAEMDGRFPFEAFERCSKLILTAVNGMAMAAGLIIVLVSDLVIASDRATFRVPETLRGLTEPYIPRRLPMMVGMAKARWLIYTAEDLSATEAETLGLVGKVVAHEQLDDAVAQTVRTVKRTGPGSRAHYKRMLAGMLPPLDLYEVLLNMRSEEAMEGMRSFAERRQPNWVDER